MNEWESVEKLGRMDLSTLFSRQAMQRSISLVPPSQQRLHKLQFLQELSCQKLCWDQARLCSLVNEQVVLQPGSSSTCLPVTSLILGKAGRRGSSCTRSLGQGSGPVLGLGLGKRR